MRSFIQLASLFKSLVERARYLRSAMQRGFDQRAHRTVRVARKVAPGVSLCQLLRAHLRERYDRAEHWTKRHIENFICTHRERAEVRERLVQRAATTSSRQAAV